MRAAAEGRNLRRCCRIAKCVDSCRWNVRNICTRCLIELHFIPFSFYLILQCLTLTHPTRYEYVFYCMCSVLISCPGSGHWRGNRNTKSSQQHPSKAFSAYYTPKWKLIFPLQFIIPWNMACGWETPRRFMPSACINVTATQGCLLKDLKYPFEWKERL